jgi:hypothetical protein
MLFPIDSSDSFDATKVCFSSTQVADFDSVQSTPLFHTSFMRALIHHLVLQELRNVSGNQPSKCQKPHQNKKFEHG